MFINHSECPGGVRRSPGWLQDIERLAGEGRAGQGRTGQGRAEQDRAGQGRTGQGRARQGRAGRMRHTSFVRVGLAGRKDMFILYCMSMSRV